MCPREGQVGPRRERRTHRLATGRHWATTLVGGGRGRRVDIRPVKVEPLVILVWKRSTILKKSELVGHYSSGAGAESGRQPVINLRKSWKLLSFLSQKITKNPRKGVAHYKCEGWARETRTSNLSKSWRWEVWFHFQALFCNFSCGQWLVIPEE